MKPGVAFGENIRTEKIRRRVYFGSANYSTKNFLLIFILFLVVGLFVVRLVYLEILQGANYRKLSDSNRIRSQVIYAPRGIITDRYGVPLVLNIPGFRQIVKDPKDKSHEKIIFLTKEQGISQLAKGGNNIAVDSLREYPFGEEFAHVLGYIGQINPAQLKEKKYTGYLVNDLVGKTGIEEEYESLLKGINGEKLIEVDAKGREVRALGQTDSIPGHDIKLTIDARIQKVVYSAAKNIKRGAVIVSKPDGEILAMVSKPSFDPNLFTQNSSYNTSSQSAYKNVTSIIFDSENQPLLNRVIGGVYPPGSTFKLVVASAGLSSRLIDGNYHIVDTGVLKVGNFSFANWFYTDYGRTESGDVNVVKALARSNDIFFYKLAELIGVDKLSSFASKFGLGKILGIDLPGEEAGTLPTIEWKKKHMHEDWYLGDTYHYGIGQGFLLTTPLQVNSWTDVIANGGTLYEPRLLKNQEVTLPAGRQGIKNQGLLDAKTVSLIREGMIESCSPGGVAWPLFQFRIHNSELRIDGRNFFKVASDSADTRQISIACKTGTAENGGTEALPHAWITLFAPAYNPQIVITVLSESSGEGSNVAGPVAKEILQAYFSELK